jgi:hypothetical protein
MSTVSGDARCGISAAKFGNKTTLSYTLEVWYKQMTLVAFICEKPLVLHCFVLLLCVRCESKEGACAAFTIVILVNNAQPL